jgi:hypothetical protein
MRAYLDGVLRVLRAPTVWLGAWGATLVVGLPLAFVLRGLIADHLGASLAAARAADGVDWTWWQEFRHQATGLAATFGPSVIGAAPVPRHVSDVLDARGPGPVLSIVVGAWLVLWSFLSGGILDRFARNRPTWASGFFAACGTHFFRFLRLGIVALLAYALLFGPVHRWLFTDLSGWLTRDLSVERTAFGIQMGLSLVFALLLVPVTLLFDYARVRIVIEDRRSALGALVASFRFIRRHAGKVLVLLLIQAVVFLAFAAAYAGVAPGVTASGAAAWAALAVGQAWILVRLGLKLTAYAASISLFQRELAHADYVAMPATDWPESPAAEALRGEPPTAAVP